MSTPASGLELSPPRFGLIPRLGVIAAVLTLETLLVSYVIQASPIDSVSGTAHLIRELQHWGFRFLIAYGMSLIMLAYLRGPALRSAVSALGVGVRPRLAWAIAHGILYLAFLWLSAAVYQHAANLPFAAAAWHFLVVATAVSLGAALAPLAVWSKAFKLTGALPLYAVIPAAGAVAAIQGSQLLWAPTAALTFRLVALLVAPFCPSLNADASTLTLYTYDFEVTVSEICSGLEGVGLMLIFCTTWLWYFRREYYFPRALVIVPLAVLLIFFLNAVRIAALVLIGTAGYPGIATVGFHSQAGWIAFNLAALAVAILARRSSWLHRESAGEGSVAGPPTAPTGGVAGRAGPAVPSGAVEAAPPVAAYLMPLIGILSAGMIAHALSAGFDLLYPLRLGSAIVCLWVYRHAYRSLDWHFSGRGVGVGALMFVVWMGFAHFLSPPAAEPPTLAALPGWERGAWLLCRGVAAVVTVPIAEELAYRGFLLRRLVSPAFDAVSFGQVRWLALGISAVAFGATHGSLWLPGVLAGLAYGLLVMKTARLGEAVAAHATTNALIAVWVLLFGQWQLW